MRQGFLQLAIVGVAACIAVYALTSDSNVKNGTNYSVMSKSEYDFINYITKYGKSYGTKEEYEYRAALFKEALIDITTQNSQNENSFHLKVNKFADWSNEEYTILLGYKPTTSTLLKDGLVKVLPTDNIPAQVDWRTSGAVNAVKDQAHCGSCWTFTAVSAMEGHHKIKTGELLSLSEQQFVDCCKVGPSDGCHGGEMWGAFECAKTSPQMLEADYPYTSAQGVYGTCLYDAAKGKVSVTAWWKVMGYNPLQLKAAIALGPVSVGIQADTAVFKYYAGGILNTNLCGTALDHGVTAIGYGVEAGREFYIIRNSWGPDWGEKGHIRIGIANGAGICGIQMDSVWPETN